MQFTFRLSILVSISGSNHIATAVSTILHSNIDYHTIVIIKFIKTSVSFLIDSVLGINNPISNCPLPNIEECLLHACFFFFRRYLNDNEESLNDDFSCSFSLFAS